MSTVLSKQFAFEQLEGAKLFLNQLNLNEKLWFLTRGNVIKAAGVSLAGLILLYLGKIWYSYRFFKKLGIKTPKIEFFYGNYRQIDTNSNALRDWTTKLGKTYGYFEGHSPVLVTSDLEIIQEVFIKQYSNFTGRKRGPVSARDSDPNNTLFSASGLRWKRMRNIINPTFSSAKLRELSPLIIKCADRLSEKLKLVSGQEINVTDHLKRFTMDSIWNCAFGLDINLQFDKSKDEYYVKCEELFQMAINKSALLYTGIYFHELRYFLYDVLVFLGKLATKMPRTGDPSPFLWLRDKVEEVVEARRHETVPRKDYLQLLMEAESTEKLEEFDKNDADYRNIHFEKKLLTEEIRTNLVLFMLAGYETTSTALSYACYVLAKHPEEQEKLYEEIESAYPGDSNIEPVADTVHNLTYLDMFIKEVLRMYPIASIQISRRCTKPTTVKGIKIPLDTDITIDVLSLHYDQELWGPVDTNEFHPPRFSPEQKRNPLAFAAFGLGPRNCVGMKFALQELKFSLVKLVKNFEVLSGPNTPDKLEYIEGAVRAPKNGVSVIFKSRKN